jgi:hypothetical protein
MSDRLLELIPHGIPERMPERNVRIDGRKDVRYNARIFLYNFPNYARIDANRMSK